MLSLFPPFSRSIIMLVYQDLITVMDPKNNAPSFLKLIDEDDPILLVCFFGFHFFNRQ
ncbi:hypothetical protein Hanom_Chr04g00374681 [Helianthus anomalus]